MKLYKNFNVIGMLLAMILVSGCSGNYGVMMFRPGDFIISPFEYLIVAALVALVFCVIDRNDIKRTHYKWYFTYSFIFTPIGYTVYRIFKTLWKKEKTDNIS